MFVALTEIQGYITRCVWLTSLGRTCHKGSHYCVGGTECFLQLDINGCSQVNVLRFECSLHSCWQPSGKTFVRFVVEITTSRFSEYQMATSSPA